jgi:hypothetical protein
VSRAPVVVAGVIPQGREPQRARDHCVCKCRDGFSLHASLSWRGRGRDQLVARSCSATALRLARPVSKCFPMMRSRFTKTFGRSVNIYGPLDSKGFCLASGDHKNHGNQNSDADHDPQNHARLRKVPLPHAWVGERITRSSALRHSFSQDVTIQYRQPCDCR